MSFPLRNDFSIRRAKQIEVTFSPASTLYGQDTMSSVIIVRTRMPASKEVVFYGGLEYGLNAEQEIWFSFQDVLENGFKLSGHLQ